MLRGLDRVRITAETDDRSYRRALIEPLGDRDGAGRPRAAARGAAPARGAARAVHRPGAAASCSIPPSVPDEDLVNALAQYLALEPVEKQALLERDGLLARCRSLIELLEMKAILAKCSTSQYGR